MQVEQIRLSVNSLFSNFNVQKLFPADYVTLITDRYESEYIITLRQNAPCNDKMVSRKESGRKYNGSGRKYNSGEYFQFFNMYYRRYVSIGVCILVGVCFW